MKKLRARLAGLCLFWKVIIALACVGIIIGLLVLAVGGYITYKLYYVMKVALPPTSTNNACMTLVYHYESGVSVAPAGVPSPLFFQGPMSGFSLQYGISTSNATPWIVTGTNLVSSTTNIEYSGTLKMLENDDSCYDFIYCTGGQFWRITYTATNDFETNYPLNVEIQSSTNLTDWQTIFNDTNCAPDAVQNFTDTNAAARSNFYRVLYR